MFVVLMRTAMLSLIDHHEQIVLAAVAPASMRSLPRPPSATNIPPSKAGCYLCNKAASRT